MSKSLQINKKNHSLRKFPSKYPPNNFFFKKKTIKQHIFNHVLKRIRKFKLNEKKREMNTHRKY